MKIAGSGALNLDLIYEVPALEAVRAAGISLVPGRETWGTYRQAMDLVEELEKVGRLLTKSGGGSAANTICALSKLGFRCLFIGSVGEDEAGALILDSMKGVDCSLVNKKGKSSLCIIALERKRRDRAMFVAPGPVHVNFSSPELETALSETVLFHMTSLVQEEGPRLQEKLMSVLSRDALVSFDPGEIYASRGYDAIKALLLGTDLLFSTDYEMKRLFGRVQEHDIILHKLLGTGSTEKTGLLDFPFFRQFSPPVMAKKMGSSGAAVYSIDGSLCRGARRVKDVVDNTGAGDAFNAGMLAAILRGRGPAEALDEAVGLAASSLAFPGRSWINDLGRKAAPAQE